MTEQVLLVLFPFFFPIRNVSRVCIARAVHSAANRVQGVNGLTLFGELSFFFFFLFLFLPFLSRERVVAQIS